MQPQSPIRRLRLHARAAFIALLAVGAQAAELAEKPRLPDFDHRRPAPAAAVAPAKHATAAKLRGLLREARVEIEPLTEAPAYVGSPREFLTGPSGEGRAVPKARMQARRAGEPYREVKAFLDEYQALYGHGAEALDAAQVRRDYTNKHNGLRSVVWQQQVDGVPVFEAVLQAHVTKRGELVNVASHFLADPVNAASQGTPRRAAALAAPAISAAQAVAIAGRNIGEAVQAADLAATGAPVGAEKKQGFRAAALRGATTHYTWLPMDKGRARLCWDVVLTGKVSGEMFRILVDAATGEAHLRHCLTNYLSEASYRVFTGDSPTPMSPSLATPATTQPAQVDRTLVTLSALDTTASPNGWINDGGNQTLGNNVNAYLDLNGSDQVTSAVQGSSFRVFDFALDLTQDPTTYQNAAVTQLFYWCNWMHDKLYQVGFNEAAGNFQTNNFGRGGAGNDPVLAEAQDGAGTNNANFSTPPDGSSGRMQMYTFNGPTPHRDGDLDGTVIRHEYTHGLSNRLVGGGVGISAAATQGMGEGWSDFYSLALAGQPGDDPNANYVMGGYVTYQLNGLTQNYYFGIRRYPYTTDLTKNPLTFRDIDPSQASAHAGIPRNPVIGNTASEVHNVGEVWFMALWEARANLIAKYGFATGNQLILQLVTDGMKLSPANPNFLQARDAIIQADLVDNAGADKNELWAAFAKRGMGASATAPSSATTTGVFESFDLPDDLGVTPVTAFNSAGHVGGPFSVTAVTYTLTNNGPAPLNWTAGNSANWLSLSSTGGNLGPGASTTVTASLNAAANALGSGTFTDQIIFTNTNTTRAKTIGVSLFVNPPDYFTELFDTTANDTAYQSFTFTPNNSASGYAVVREPASGFPSNTSNGTPIPLSDNSSALVSLTDGATVKIYGFSRSFFFVGSNGYITFGGLINGGDSTAAESLAAHFARRRISALFRDLDPGAGGAVRWQQFTDRAAVTWQGVPEAGTTNSNNFQIEMFFDGRIRITILGIGATHGLIGLSAGNGVPVDFANSGFSTYPLATLGVVQPAQATEGAGPLTNQGTVTLSTSSAVARTITLTSSDPTSVTVPATVTLPSGQSSVAFTPTILDDNKINGTRAVTITASATGLSPASGVISILDNESTNLTLTLANLAEGTTATGTVSTSGTWPADLVVSLISSNPARLGLPATVTIPAGSTSASFTETAVDNNLTDGTAIITITASAPNFTAGSGAVTVLDNDLHHYAISAIGSPQVRGLPFNATITALTIDGLTLPNFNGSVNLTTQSGAPVTPASAALTGGTATIAITVGAFATGTALLVTDAGGHTGTSNNFDVTFGALDHFAWAATGANRINNLPFPVRITALDSAGNTVASFTGAGTLDCGTPTNRTVPLSPATTGNFIGGVWTGNIAVGQVISGVTLRATSGPAIGESGVFSVLGAQQDLSHNGVPNLLKYAFNLDPQSPSLAGLPASTIEVNPADQARYLTLRYRRLLAPGTLQYLIEVSSDLQTWTGSATDFEELAPTVPNADGLTETVTVRVKPSIGTPGASARYVRVRLLAP